MFNEENINNSVLTKVDKIIKNNRLHQCYIIESSYDSDKLGFAKWFAAEVISNDLVLNQEQRDVLNNRLKENNYLDVFILKATVSERSKIKSIKVEDVKQVQEFLTKKPYEGKRNIVIIRDADFMNAAAYNKLLKTLEEPAVGSLIFLLSENSSLMPDTIRSRCASIRLNDVNDEIDRELIDTINELILLIIDNEYFYKIKTLIDKVTVDRDRTLELLDGMEQRYRDLLFGKGEEHRRFTKEYVFNAVSAIEKARREIQINVKASYALGKMVLNIGG
ncbi:MAG: hypothetical protein RR420_07230 [Anaerovoracaceae bacterium]